MGYLDPGLFGLLSQVGLTILLLLVSAFAFFFKPIKRFFLMLIKREKSGQDEPAPGDNPISQ